MQTHVQTDQNKTGRKWPALSRWRPYIPLLILVAWLVYKQAWALKMMHMGRGYLLPIASAGLLLILLPWVFRLRGRAQVLAAALMTALITLISYTDVVYYRHFGDLASIASMRFAGQLGAVTDVISQLLKPEDIWYWVDVILLLLIALLPVNKLKERLQAPLQLSRKSVAGLAALGAVMFAIPAKFDPLLSHIWFGNIFVARQLGVLNYHVVDAGKYAARLSARLRPPEELVTEVQSFFETPQDTTPASPLHGVAGGRNLIVVQFESLQGFVLGMEVEGQEVTPNLNRLMGESMYFTDFYSQTGQGNTADAGLLMNCSLYPTRTGAVYYDYADNDYRCMPGILREQGYKAVVMHGYRPDFWNRSSVYPHMGFERYYNIKDGFVFDEKVGMGLSDESFFRQAAEHLSEMPEPFYSFLITLTSHNPFAFEGLPQLMPLGEFEGTFVGDYLNSIHYADMALGQFLEDLEARGLLDRSVLVVYGDHLGVGKNHGGVGRLGITLDNPVSVTEFEKKVPLLIRLPEGEVTGQWPETAGQVDLAPTLISLLGLQPENTYFMGRDLLEETEGAVAFYKGSALNSKYFFQPDEGNPALGQCFDRATQSPTDPEYCRDLAEEATRDLRISRLMVERNLLKRLNPDQSP